MAVVCDGVTSGVAGVTTTDVNGAYAFEVREGTYEVEFQLPADFLFTMPKVGSNDVIDSDADINTGLTGSFSLTAGQVNTNLVGAPG